MSDNNPLAVVASDVQTAVAAFVAGLTRFGEEARLALSWIDKSVPGAEQALAELFQVADVAATALEAQASGGLADIVAAAIGDAGATVANLISASGLDLAAKSVLSAADVATVSAAKSISQNAISVATARLLGSAARAAPANAANAVAGRELASR